MSGTRLGESSIPICTWHPTREMHKLRMKGHLLGVEIRMGRGVLHCSVCGWSQPMGVLRWTNVGPPV